MNLYIDDEKVTFQLENEKNLYDVINSVNKFLEKSGRHISKVILNKKNDLDFDDENMLKDIDLDSVDILSIYSNTPVGNAVDSLVEIKSYIEKLIHYLENNTEKIIQEQREFVQGIRWIINGTIGSVYTIGLNIDVIFYRSLFLKEELSNLNKISKDLEDTISDNNAFSLLINNNLKNILEGILVFIKIIGIRLYFNLFYTKDKDVYLQKTKELFVLNKETLLELKGKLTEIKNKIKEEDISNSDFTGKRLLIILSTISNDIILACKVLKFDLSNNNINQIKSDKFLSQILNKINDLNNSLKNGEKKDIIGFVDSDDINNYIKGLNKLMNETLTKVKS